MATRFAVLFPFGGEVHHFEIARVKVGTALHQHAEGLAVAQRILERQRKGHEADCDGSPTASFCPHTDGTGVCVRMLSGGFRWWELKTPSQGRGGRCKTVQTFVNQ